MEVNILGTLEASVNGTSIVPTAGKPRQVLSLLAINAGQLVTVPTLVEELWGLKTPRSAVQTVQTYILGLRKRITQTMPAGRRSEARNILATRPCGYTLNIPLDDVDMNRYQDLAGSGQRALTSGDYESASKLLGAGLDIWRGPALVDVQTGPRLDIEITRLEQTRLTMLEFRIEADLKLGRHHQLLPELASLTAQYPLHEKMCAHYMAALHVCGMKWRALEVFWNLRATLVRELGVEPSIQVQRLQRAILSSDGGDTADWKLAALG
jgi:DNA-binding SARP family transcriptional activator